MDKTVVNIQNQSAGVAPGRGEKIRKSGIELLRIILMLQVIFLHVCTKGQYSDFGNGHLGKWHELFYWCIWLMCRCPVYVYFLISGYFSVASNKSLGQIKGKVWKTYTAMLFYSITLPLVGILFGWWQMTPRVAAMMFLPNITRVWYFMTLYLIVLFLSPYLNKCLTALGKREYQALVAMLMILLSVVPTLSRFEPFGSFIVLKQIISPEGGKSLYDAIFMYIFGGYIRLHTVDSGKARVRYLVYFFLLTAVNVLLRYTVPGYQKTAGTFDNSLVILQGVCLFLFFRGLQFRSVWVNRIAALNLGVYMIHEHMQLGWIIWNNIFPVTRTKEFYMTRTYPFKILFICIAIFAGCGLIEQCRVWIFGAVRKLRRKDTKQF